MGLLWTFMGASTAYQMFAGFGEALGGLLLLFRRTALLGALVSSAVMLNVVMLNFCYDVPVKLFSSHLLLIAVVLAAPHASRLAAVLVLNRPADMQPFEPLVSGRRAQVALRIAHGALVALILFGMVAAPFIWRSPSRVDSRPPLYGVWNVTARTADGDRQGAETLDDAALQRVIFNEWGGASMQWVSGDFQRFRAEVDLVKGTISFADRFGSAPPSIFTIERPEEGMMVLRGTIRNQTYDLTLRLAPERSFLLRDRGFHWINEYPFNR